MRPSASSTVFDLACMAEIIAASVIRSDTFTIGNKLLIAIMARSDGFTDASSIALGEERRAAMGDGFGEGAGT